MIKKENKQREIHTSAERRHTLTRHALMIQISSLGNPEKTESCF
jgi:hypothetical protein